MGKKRYIWLYLKPCKSRLADNVSYSGDNGLSVQPNLIRADINKAVLVSTSAVKNFLKILFLDDSVLFLDSSLLSFLRLTGNRFTLINKSEALALKFVDQRLCYKYLFIGNKRYKVTYEDNVKKYFK